MPCFIEDFKMKNIAFFLLFFLLVSGHSNANAVGGSIGGWRITSNVAQGIGAKITATKDVIINGASRAVTSSAYVIPSSSQVGRFMGKNLGAAAVIGAMDLILDGVDYVMDPVNNTVRYNTKAEEVPFDHPSVPTIFVTSGQTPTRSSSPSGSCSLYNQNFIDAGSEARFKFVSVPQVGTTYGKCVNTAKETSYALVTGFSNTAYDPNVEAPAGSRPVTVPISDVASQVLDQAEEDIKAGNVASPAVVLSRAVAQDMVQEAEADDTKARPISTELDKNTPYPSDTDIEGEITTPEVVDPVTGEVVKPAETSSIAMKFPKACEWFPQACLFIDWVMTDPNVDSDMEVPEKEIEKQEIKKDLVKISGRSCPTDVKFDVDGLPFGIKINKAYSMQEICNTVEPLKYVFELITAVICALILLRV